MRIYTYLRVSTEEQKNYGLSVDTQRENLQKWARDNGHTIIREYNDAGISGKKPISKRPALQQILVDMEREHVDMVVFTKLDRWFRSVKEYYKVQEVLERNHVVWKAIQEDYETETSAGRFKVNIMLSVAEAEADRTSERIKVVMEAKRRRKECVTGHVPIGYKLDGKKIVKDPDKAPIVETFFAEYLRTGSIKGASDAAEAATGYHFYYRHASDTLANPSYYGCFYGIEDYAPAYIDKETFDRIQSMRRRVTRTPKANQVYLFSGLIVCGECGLAFCPRTQRDRKIPPSVYNCRGRYEKRACENRVNIDERHVEAFILDNIGYRFEKYKMDMAQQKKSVSNPNKAAVLRRKAEKLKDLYLADLLTFEELKKEKAAIDAQLEVIEKPIEDHTKEIGEWLSQGWREQYENSSKDAKKAFWMSLLKEIRIYKDRHIEFDLR